MSEQDVGSIALVRCLRLQRLDGVGGSSCALPVKNEVIGIPDDGNVEKFISKEIIVGSEPYMVVGASERLGVESERGGMGVGSRLFHFGHVRSPAVDAVKVVCASGVMFSTSWYLKDDSCLSLFEFVVNFTYNSFPPGT